MQSKTKRKFPILRLWAKGSRFSQIPKDGPSGTLSRKMSMGI